MSVCEMVVAGKSVVFKVGSFILVFLGVRLTWVSQDGIVQQQGARRSPQRARAVWRLE